MFLNINNCFNYSNMGAKFIAYVYIYTNINTNRNIHICVYILYCKFVYIGDSNKVIVYN